MDIRDAANTSTNSNALANGKGNGGRRSNAAKYRQSSTYKAGQVMQASTEAMLPPFIAAKMSHISQVYGFPVDMGKVSLKDATPQNLKALRTVSDMIASNSKLLPEFLRLVQQVLNADIKLAEFHKKLTKAALEHQERIDQETAEIFLAMARYGAKASKLEHRTNTRAELVQKRAEAYEQLYSGSVFGNESRVIDVEFEVAASNNKLLSESKSKRLQFNAARKAKLQAYIDEAYSSEGESGNHASA